MPELSFFIPQADSRIEFFNPPDTLVSVVPAQPGEIKVGGILEHLISVASGLTQEDYDRRLQKAIQLIRKHNFSVQLQDKESDLQALTETLNKTLEEFRRETATGVDSRYYEGEIDMYPVALLALLGN